ncbi:MAG: hypothetical protein PHR16_16935 [Methylovulum sp.]|nr:hypothetical protein [Methylovulum sp.]
MEHSQEQVKSSPVQILMPENINIPCIHVKKFCEINGLSEGVVGGWLDRQQLLAHYKEIGRYCMVNLVLLTERCRGGAL